MNIIIDQLFKLTDLYNHVSRKIVGITSTLGGIVAGVLPSDNMVNAPEISDPTWSDVWHLFITILVSPESMRMLIGASIGATVGGIAYIIMWPVKRWLFSKYPIDVKHIKKEIKEH